MNGKDEAACPGDRIAKMWEVEGGVSHHPSTGTQFLREIHANSPAVVVGVDEGDDKR
jgi:hypothetical protein